MRAFDMSEVRTYLSEVAEGDILFLFSDGVTDNLAPTTRGNMRWIEEAEAKLRDIVSESNTVSPMNATERIVQKCFATTQQYRRVQSELRVLEQEMKAHESQAGFSNKEPIYQALKKRYDEIRNLLRNEGSFKPGYASLRFARARTDSIKTTRRFLLSRLAFQRQRKCQCELEVQAQAQSQSNRSTPPHRSTISQCASVSLLAPPRNLFRWLISRFVRILLP
jgi:hypothetical protein